LSRGIVGIVVGIAGVAIEVLQLSEERSLIVSGG